jgi:hypothetical protein
VPKFWPEIAIVLGVTDRLTWALTIVTRLGCAYIKAWDENSRINASVETRRVTFFIASIAFCVGARRTLQQLPDDES